MTEKQEKELLNHYIVQRAEAIKNNDTELLELYEWLDKTNYKLISKGKTPMLPIIEHLFGKEPRFVWLRGEKDVE